MLRSLIKDAFAIIGLATILFLAFWIGRASADCLELPTPDDVQNYVVKMFR